jgi:hypothetical protein
VAYDVICVLLPSFDFQPEQSLNLFKLALKLREFHHLRNLVVQPRLELVPREVVRLAVVTALNQFYFSFRPLFMRSSRV